MQEPNRSDRNGREQVEARGREQRQLRAAGDEVFTAVLVEAVDALEKADIPYVLIGGLASSGFGRPRTTKDIDLFVKPEDAERTLTALEAAGFSTERTNPQWLYKGFKHDVLVDVIFRSTGNIYLDTDMWQHAVISEVAGKRMRFIAPEDLLVMKAVVADEEGPRHWHDALGLIAARNLDWDYLRRRAQKAPRRVLSLFVYAHSLDMFVPNEVIRSLFEQLYQA